MKRLPFRIHMTSAQMIPLSFLTLILGGSLILMLPVSTASGEKTSFLTAFFTSTTSVCVTGSVVVDTCSYWSLFGKVVILLLIQIGGLGLIAVCALLALAARKRFSLNGTLLLRDMYNLDNVRGINRFLIRVFLGTLLVEIGGTIGYAPAFISRFGLIRGLWYSFFTSVSAFCNAGIDIIGSDSLIGYQYDTLVLLTTIAMIIMGGLGYVVWFDVMFAVRQVSRKKYRYRYLRRSLSEHTRLVLRLTLVLIVAGTVLIFLLEYDNPGTLGGMSVGWKVLNSLFQSVTFRTAGFITVPQEQLTEASTLVGDVLMFIGGSPVGTAGGVKTVTAFVLIANVITFLRGRNEMTVLNRSISDGLIRKATAIVSVHFMMAFLFCMILMVVSKVSFIDAMYEIMSAISTVGVSRGLTSSLNDAGKWIVVIAMFLGRIGPISMLLLFNPYRTDKNKVHYADGRFIVG